MDFEERLDRCIEDLRAGRSLETALQEHPQEASELRPLLQLAEGLEDLPTPEPTTQGLMRAMVHNATREKPPQSSGGRVLSFLPPCLVRIAASIALIFMLGWGTTVASSGTVPGELLYPVKRLTEDVKMFLTFSDENEAEMRIVFSGERLKEAFRKHTRGDGVDEDLLASMLEEARLAVEEAAHLPALDRKRVVAQASSTVAYQKQVLADMKNQACECDCRKLDRWMDRCQSRWEWMCGIQEEQSSQDRPPSSQQWREKGMRECPMFESARLNDPTGLAPVVSEIDKDSA